MAPPGPVKIGHKKDGHQRRPHRFHVSRPPPYPATGSATDTCTILEQFFIISGKGLHEMVSELFFKALLK